MNVIQTNNTRNKDAADTAMEVIVTSNQHSRADRRGRHRRRQKQLSTLAGMEIPEWRESHSQEEAMKHDQPLERLSLSCLSQLSDDDDAQTSSSNPTTPSTSYDPSSLLMLKTTFSTFTCTDRTAAVEEDDWFLDYHDYGDKAEKSSSFMMTRETKNDIKILPSRQEEPSQRRMMAMKMPFWFKQRSDESNHHHRHRGRNHRLPRRRQDTITPAVTSAMG